MHRLIPIGLTPAVLLVALLSASPVPASEAEALDVEAMAQRFERLFQPSSSRIKAKDLVFTDHGGGLYSLSYPLPSPAVENAAGLRSLGDDDDKLIRTLDIGHMASEPANPGSMMSAVVADPQANYNLWWAVLNRSELEETRKTTIRVEGPDGFLIDVSDEVVYLPNAVNLFWFNPEVPFAETGIYTFRGTVRTGGRLFYRFWVEPLAAE